MSEKLSWGFVALTLIAILLVYSALWQTVTQNPEEKTAVLVVEPPTRTPAMNKSYPLNEEELEYLEEAVIPLERIADAIVIIGDALPNYQADDANMAVQVARASLFLVASHNELASKTPPPRFRNFHNQVLSATEQCKIVGEELPLALDNENWVLIIELIEPMQLCGERMDKAHETLNSVLMTIP